MTLFDPTPVARHSDPSTAHEAAARVKSGSHDMEEAILLAARWPETAFVLAILVERFWPGRWDPASIRTAVSRLHKAGKLRKTDEVGRSPRGQKCARYVKA